MNIEVFVDAPNDAFVTSGTRFWNSSGVDFSVNADGLKVRTQSVVSLLVGGVAFEPVYTARGANKPAPADAEFELYSTEAQAKANPDGEAFDIRMRFDQSIRGLAVGALVDFSGITLGNVTGINLISTRRPSASTRWSTPRSIRNAWAASTKTSASWPIRMVTWTATGCWAA